MIGKIISHYNIIEEIGRGGMGMVYKAEDTKLNRIVALKFLPPELTHDQESKERFIREAQAASALEHDNICTIHEINETEDGQMFIVMACYEGQTLKARIKDQRLKTKEAIDIATQIAKGLQKAHEKDIVHRDIKPANIYITYDGHVKILDFGLAKLAGQAQLTKDSSTLGTVAYMSPEQIQGKEVDHRTDIWSLGVIVYEMLSGEMPFKGDYEQAISYAILSEKPKALENTSAELWDIINKMLCKNPEERYSNATELLNDFTAILGNMTNNSPQKYTNNARKRIIIVSAVAILILFAAIIGVLFFPTSKTETSIKSLAVLPFSNNKPDSNTDYLGLAFAAEIISDMAYFKNINTLPFSSVRQISSKEELNVDFVLAGNFIKLGDRISLNIECFEKETNRIIWQESLNRPFKESHILLSDVSEKVINGLKIQFSSEERSRMHMDVSSNPLAYEYYLKSFAYPYTVEGSLMAIEMLNQSIQIDSTYAPAYYELGYHTIRISQFLLGSSEKHIKAEKYLLKAISLNRDYIDARTLLAGIYTERGNAERAFIIAKEALGINPNNARTQFRLSYIFRYTGLNEESIRSIEKALVLLPNNPRFRSARQNFIYVGNFQRALEVSDLDKTNPISIADKGILFLMLGDTTRAIDFLQRSIKMESDSSTYAFNLAKAYLEFLNGQYQNAKKYIQRIEAGNLYDGEQLIDIVSIYGFIGDHANCIRVLEQAVEAGFYNYPFFLIDPFLDPVRDDPEFQRVLALAKGKHDAFKKIYYAEKE